MVAGWLAAAVLVSFVHPFLPDSRWLLVHLLLLGAVSSAVMIWSGHFAATLLRVPEPAPAATGIGGIRVRVTGVGGPGARLAVLNAGALAVVGGLLADRWEVVLGGAVLVASAAVVHGVALIRAARRALPGRFGIVVRYYVAAALALPVGAGLGAVLARDDLAGGLEARVRVAHEAVNLLGWVGLTVAGTLVTFWPTMLRTRMADGAERAARRSLPLLLGGTSLTAAGALAGPPPVAAPGVLVYLAGVALLARPMRDAARARPPSSVATWSVLAGAGWLVASLLGLIAVLSSAADWTTAGERLALLTAPLAAGWVAQTLLGALTYLVPVLVGGGPRVVRALIAVLERGGPARVTAANAALLVAVLPVASVVRVACASLVLALFLAYPVLLVRAALLGRRLRAGRAPEAVVAPDDASTPPRRAGVAAGLAVVALVTALGSALDPAGLPQAGSQAPPVTPTGHTTTVTVRAVGMRFVPDRIDVPVGDRLVVVLHNTDEDAHDLVLATGRRTPRVAPGATGTLDAGVIGGDVQGWCSVIGHRQMGMVLAVRALGAAQPAPSHAGHATDTSGPGVTYDAAAGPAAAFAAHDARLAPVPAGSTAPRVIRRTITVREVDREVAPGVRQRVWTFDGTVPGPTLRGRVGDTFEITLVNGGSIGHSIDFHAGTQDPRPVMRTIQPGQSLQYRFTARRSGIWMYHCSTMPMSLHLANGMFGAVVVDPPGLAPVDREYALVQSELYLGPPGGTADIPALQAEQPDAVVFNGYAAQYAARPLAATAGERVRIWVLAAGPNRGTSFHVVGGQFDTVYAEGAYRLRRDASSGGAQVLDLAPAAGGFVELTFPEPGTYPFVSHRMVDAERGARGAFAVSASTP